MLFPVIDTLRDYLDLRPGTQWQNKRSYSGSYVGCEIWKHLSAISQQWGPR